MLLLVDLEVRILLIKALFFFSLAISKHQTAQFKLLLFVIVWSDLIEPQPDILSVVLFFFGGFDVFLGRFFKLNYHFVFSLAPRRIFRTRFVISVTIFSFRSRRIFAHF